MRQIKKVVACLVSWLLILCMALPPGAVAQDQGPTKGMSQAELDQMLAPIALYPDSLLAQILMAATYPLEVVMADRWAKAHKGLTGDQLNAEVDKQDWDPSVKALVPFPQVLDMMSEKLAWTERLGEAFLDQQDAVMNSVQRLREKAKEAGNLKSSKEQRVATEGTTVVIEPVDPEVIYVPVYNPFIVYGPWWWPDYPPFWYYPPGFVVVGVVFSFPFFCRVGPFWWFGWGHWDWGHRRVFVNVDRHININQRHFGPANFRTETWRHDVAHRRGVLYGNEADRVRFGQTSRGSMERRTFRGFAPTTATPVHPPVAPQTIPQGKGPSTQREFHATPQTVPQGKGPVTQREFHATPQTVPQTKGPGTFTPGKAESGTNRTIFGGSGGIYRGSEVKIQRERGFQSRGSSFSHGGGSIMPHGGGGVGGGGGHGGGGGDSRR